MPPALYTLVCAQLKLSSFLYSNITHTEQQLVHLHAWQHGLSSPEGCLPHTLCSCPCKQIATNMTIQSKKLVVNVLENDESFVGEPQ